MSYPPHPVFLDEVEVSRRPTVHRARSAALHLYGPTDGFPSADGPMKFLPQTDPDIRALLRMHATLGLNREIVAQPTHHHVDHRVVFDAREPAGHRQVLVDNPRRLYAGME